MQQIIRIIGYNQSGDGFLLDDNYVVNDTPSLNSGFISRLQRESTRALTENGHFFLPTSEIVVDCPVQGGQSGGPCVDSNGKVIGILSRTDPLEPRRCYLAPSDLILELLNTAKHNCKENKKGFDSLLDSFEEIKSD